MPLVIEIPKLRDEDGQEPPLPAKEPRNRTQSCWKSTIVPFLCLFFFGALISIFIIFSLKATSSQQSSFEKSRKTGIVVVPPQDLPTEFKESSTKGSATDIGSWFNCNENVVNGITTGTNGNSWCGYPYNDSMVGFAISIIIMCGTAQCQYYDGARYQEATSKYCGLEAWTYNPRTRRNVTGVILDAFAPQYLEDMGHTAGSIDATPALFTLLGN